MRVFDAVVIGSGPAGMSAALYLCRFGLNTALVEKLGPGGQLLNTSEISNYPGFPKGAEGWDLAQTFRAHLDDYPLAHLNDEVQSITRSGKFFRLHFGSETIESKTVIICSGAQPSRLGLVDEVRLTGKGVSYCAMCDGMFFKDQVVAVAGGGNAALEEAVFLTNIVKKLYLIHRRPAFRADRVYQEKIKAHADKIELVLGYTISDLHGEDSLTALTVQPVQGGASRTIEVNGLFVFIGTQPTAGYFPEGLATDSQGFVMTDCEMRTNIPGVFAAGDIRSKLCRQVVTAVGDGATAAHAAFSYLETLEI